MAPEETDLSDLVDPDILDELDGNYAGLNRTHEKTFKEFFVSDWLDPKYDDIRERWDPLIHDSEARRRVLGKVALWSLVRLRALQEGKPFEIDRPKGT